MAECLQFVCGHCHHSVEAWSDGNPYYLDETGTKQYAYHPDHEKVERCIGNESPYLCLGCGAEFDVDSAAPTSTCPVCGVSEIVDTYCLAACRCPYCKAGEFVRDPNFFCIS